MYIVCFYSSVYVIELLVFLFLDSSYVLYLLGIVCPKSTDGYRLIVYVPGSKLKCILSSAILIIPAYWLFISMYNLSVSLMYVLSLASQRSGTLSVNLSGNPLIYNSLFCCENVKSEKNVRANVRIIFFIMIFISLL